MKRRRLILKTIKLAYIGGGSRNWARTFMNDLTLNDYLDGEIALYDIDVDAAKLNQQIGRRMNGCDNAKSHWDYQVYENIDDALRGADFVACSILPGTFDEMAVDVHMPEKYGIFQSVGDTVGPGGVIRAMRTVPIYEFFARKFKEICPNAWIINLTNPMYICTKTLYDVFPEVKAFGCCHEVFGAEDLLCDVIADICGIERPNRRELSVDVNGINHFTWITNASYKDMNAMDLLPEFVSKYYETGFVKDKERQERDCFCYAHRIKMDLYLRFGILAAAGDRHLVEFLNKSWYLNNREHAESWMYHLTTVMYRKSDMKKKIKLTEEMADGTAPIVLKKSNEEIVRMMQALAGYGPYVTNANVINRGQSAGLPNGFIAETMCEFAYNSVKPIKAADLPKPVQNLVNRNAFNIETTYEGIKNRDLNLIFESFINQPLCSSLSLDDGLDLFANMVKGTQKYLADYGLTY